MILFIGVTPLLVDASGTSNSVAGAVYVLTTCVPGVSNTAVRFGGAAGLSAGGWAATANIVQVTNLALGNAPSNIFVSGGSWSNALWPSGNSFGVQNTLWNPTYNAGNVGNALTGSAVDTQKTIAVGGSATVYFGLNIPTTVNANMYAQTMTIATSC